MTDKGASDSERARERERGGEGAFEAKRDLFESARRLEIVEHNSDSGNNDTG